MSAQMGNYKISILFVCNENSARSQMAEAFLRERFGNAFEAYSAGLTPKPAISPLAVQVMNEIEIDISRQVPKGFSEAQAALGARHFDYIISVCDANAMDCPLVSGNVIPLNMPIPDPAVLANATDDIDIKPGEFRLGRDRVRNLTITLARLLATGEFKNKSTEEKTTILRDSFEPTRK